MKLLSQISVATLVLATSLSAHADFKRVGKLVTSNSSVKALPKIMNSPITIKAGSKPGTFTVETDLFINTCGLAKTSMPDVSSADVLATVQALQTLEEIPGFGTDSREFLREDLSGAVRCRVDIVQDMTFLVNGCSSALFAQNRIEGAILVGSKACDAAFVDFAKN